MSKEMTKEELQEIKKHFEIANNQVRKQVDERNIIKGKLLAFDLIIDYLNEQEKAYDDNCYYWTDQLKKQKTPKEKKDIQCYIDRSDGTAINLSKIVRELQEIKGNIATDFFK